MAIDESRDRGQSLGVNHLDALRAGRTGSDRVDLPPDHADPALLDHAARAGDDAGVRDDEILRGNGVSPGERAGKDSTDDKRSWLHGREFTAESGYSSRINRGAIAFASQNETFAR